MGWYDGTTDPDDFLQRDEGTVCDQAWNDETKCLEFQTLLQGVAREWFSNLPLPLVTSYNDLRAHFLLNFHNMRAYKKTHVKCHEIRQGTRESLGQFIDRYTKEVAKMAGLLESQKVFGFIHRLCRERHFALWQHLYMKVLDTLADAIKEAHEHMRAREDITRNSEKTPMAKFQKSSSSDQGKGRFPSQNFAIMRELTKTPKEILATEPICMTFSAPAKMSEYARRDKSKYCEFHDDYGHKIDRCKSFIEKVIECLRRGELNHLKPLKKKGTVSHGNQLEKTAPNQKKGGDKISDKTINMVHAWRSGQRRKAEQLEEWEAEAIIFPPMQTINPSHASIIIKVRITDYGYNVRRLNVDMGSNVDLMYEHCFRQLPATIKSKMRAPTTVLSGFSGKYAWPLGCIELELELVDDNDSTRTRAVPVEFCVVRSYSCYNALLGRVTL
ncbi:uncharacterized protein [Rutidosis leptorrhynchoides]|uniref:uncharacterized protein n=1 Tax=Rutidosis leptorrhynchoides TaxID=125765 RepID=UPI003A999233